MRVSIVCALFFFIPFFPGAEEIFKSNSIGMTLEKISEYRRDNFEYVAVLDRKESGESVKTLYKNGEEHKRWIIDEVNGEKIETLYEEGNLTEQTVYLPNGNIKERTRYIDDETIEEQESYVYSGGELDHIVVRDGEGEELYTIRYEKGKYGRLRRMVRVYPEKTTESIYTYGAGNVSSEWHGKGNEGDMFRFGKDQQVKAFEYWEGMDKVSVTEYRYSEGSREYSVSVDYLSKIVTKTWYDKNGLALRELKETEDALVSETDFIYDDEENLIEKTLRRPGVREKWEYSYNGGDEVKTEIYYKNGTLVSEINYVNDSEYIEYLYRRGKRFIKITYENDIKTEETLLIDSAGGDDEE